jgi:hypothetical protein
VVRALLILLVAGLTALGWPASAVAKEPVLIGPEDGPEGMPHVVLDRLVVPNTVPEYKRVTRVLEKALKHEARRVQWGAGRESRISYRFFLEELEVTIENGVYKVRCTALGRLPKGKSARSKLELGGDPRDPRKIIDQVLVIVARGVLARLADLERDRRARH